MQNKIEVAVHACFVRLGNLSEFVTEVRGDRNSFTYTTVNRAGQGSKPPPYRNVCSLYISIQQHQQAHVLKFFSAARSASMTAAIVLSTHPPGSQVSMHWWVRVSPGSWVSMHWGGLQEARYPCTGYGGGRLPQEATCLCTRCKLQACSKETTVGSPIVMTGCMWHAYPLGKRLPILYLLQAKQHA